MKKGTAFDDRRRRWGPFIKELVGEEHGAPVGVTEYVRAFNSLRPEHRIKGERRHLVREEDRRAIYKQVAGKRAPQAANAWWHGKALAVWYPWAGGPLGLYAAGHLADFVGVFACLEPKEVRSHPEALSALNNTAYAATYGNVLEMNPQYAAALKERGVVLPPSADQELQRLSHREAARTVWATGLNSELGRLFDEAWTRWSILARRPKLTRYVGHAYRIALDRSFTFLERVQLVTHALTSWINTTITCEPPELAFASEDYVDLIAGLTSAGARRARLMLLTYWCAAQLLQDEDWFPEQLGAADGIAGRHVGASFMDQLSRISAKVRQ